ncbi:MAG: hypothetical protein LBQ22_04065 [Bacteroidales bacterium]|jgi:hypothetical protein|nr:hypothetical protein [Bacteroidales bacterium]
MKNFNSILFFIAVAVIFQYSGDLSAQKLLKGVEKNYDSGVSAFERKKYKEASAEFIIVMDNIPQRADKRKYQLMRLDAASKLVEIHYNYDENLRLACKYLDIFIADLNYMKRDDNLKAKDIYKYLEKEKDFSSYKKKCTGFNTIDDKKNEFEKKFDEVFDEEE